MSIFSRFITIIEETEVIVIIETKSQMKLETELAERKRLLQREKIEAAQGPLLIIPEVYLPMFSHITHRKIRNSKQCLSKFKIRR